MRNLYNTAMVKVSNEFALHVPTIFLTALEIHKIDLKNPLISKEKYKSSLTQKSQSHFFFVCVTKNDVIQIQII